jgi:Cys-rich repeat protein
VALASMACVGCRGDADVVADETSDSSATPESSKTTATATASIACERYLDCVAAVDPAGLPVAVDGFGPAGNCWSPETADLCHAACRDARRELWSALPTEAACTDCDDDALCHEQVPYCDTQRGTCEECLVDAHCPGALSCDAGTCVCDANADCADHGCYDGVCGAPPLFPLMTGRSWIYEIEALGVGVPECPPGMSTATLSPGTEHPEGTSVTYTTVCSTEASELIGLGDEVLRWVEPLAQWQPLLAEPVQDGHTWIYDNGEAVYMFEWRRESGPVTVPAGTFTDCWTRVVQDVQASTYCRGVGKVFERYGDQTGWIARLAAVR